MIGRVWYFILVGSGAVAIVAQSILAPTIGLPWSMAGLAALVVGAILAWRVPSNPISWLLLMFGNVSAISALFLIVVQRAPDQTAAGWFDAIFYAINTASVMLLPIILLRFPDGSLPSKRWRVVEWTVIGGGVVGATAALLNGGWGGDGSQATVVSPLYDSTTPAGDILSSIFFPLFAVSFVAAAMSQILRYRASTGESRLQIKWLAYSAGFLILGMGVVLADSGFAAVATDTAWEATVMALGFTSIPIAIGIAVLRYRLYDIDVVISRTVVFAILAIFITATYVVVVVGVGRLIGGGADGLLLPIVATALVALAFEPVRSRAQRWANRLVYGKRSTPYEVLSDLTERLADAEEGDRLLERMATLLRDGTGAESAAVWLGEPGAMTRAVSSPKDAESTDQPTLDAVLSFPVAHNGEVIGALEVVKPKGSVLSTAERSLLSDLAGSAGAVLGYQRLNDSLETRARELEASRARLVGAQDSERRRLERELHEGAEQYIVAIKVKIGVASQVAGKHDAADLEKLLNGLSDEAQAALDDVQSLAKGIYPPILESDGLGVAISGLASSAPVEVSFQRDGIGRYPAEVEAAVYFDVSEAVTNAVKHANAPIHIELSDSEGVLRFSVVDSGPGFDIDESDMGSGLENMADRVESIGGSLSVSSASGKHTEVTGTIPLVPATRH